MVKHYKDYDRSLVESGKWKELVNSFSTGIYEVQMPDYSSLRSLQVTLSKFNADVEYKYKFSTSVNYKVTPIVIRIEVDKR